MRLPTPSQLALLGLLIAGGAAAQGAPGIPEGYTAVPFLSEAPKQSFTKPGQVLEEGKDYGAVLVTNKGTLVLDLFEDQAPQTVNSFVFLARHHFYDGIVFHRVLDGFMAQTGDPTGTGTGGPGYAFDDEIADGLSFGEVGTVAMANAGPDTNGSQFFITFAETPWLDGGYSIFGEVVQGAEVLPELQRVGPSQEAPSLAFLPSDPLSVVREGGVALAGGTEQTLETYLTQKLGATPKRGERFDVDGYTGLIGQGGDGQPLVGFYPQPDVIESLTIIEKDAG